MQIERSEAEGLRLTGPGREVEEGPARVCKRESVVEAGVRGGCEVGIGSGAGRMGAERGEPCRVFELWASRFMSQQ